MAAGDMPTAALLRPHLYHFENFTSGVVQASNVDRANGIIRNVAIITNGVTARGHEMEVDGTTLKQLHGLGTKKGKVPVKLDHGSGITSVCGHLKNFRIKDKKWIGDWHLLKSHSEYETTMERAETMPECFGMSAAFMGGPVLETGEPVQIDDKGPHKGVPYVLDAKGKRKMLTGDERKFARATELRAVDCVTDPAANPDGLFSAKDSGVDTQNLVMPRANANTPAEPADEPTLASLAATMQQILEGQTAMQSRMEALEQQTADPGEYSLDELNGMTDAELTGLGLSRQQVVDAVAQAEAAIAEQDAADAGGTPGAPAAGAAAPAANSAVMAELSDLRRQVTFMASERNAEKRAAKEAETTHFFDNLESQIELAEKTIKDQAATIEALELSLKTGGSKPVKPGTAEVVLFSSKTSNPSANGTFEALAGQKFTELSARVGTKEVPTIVHAKSQAIDFARKESPDAWAEYRQRGGKLVLK